MGNLSAIEHATDTGASRPIKQRMRERLRASCKKRKHICKNVAGRRYPTAASDWASAPVLIRKLDAQVRLCVDYRELLL